MGDRTTVTLYIGGNVEHYMVHEIISTCLEFFASSENWGNLDTHEEVYKELFMERRGLIFEEVNYADLTYLETYLKVNNLSYDKTWCAGDNYSPGGEIYVDGNLVFSAAFVDGSPVLDKGSILYNSKTDPTMNWLTDWLERSSTKIPDLEVIPDIFEESD